MTVQQAQPLPECLGGCGGPMRREDFAAADGVCSSCRDAQRRSAVQLELDARFLGAN